MNPFNSFKELEMELRRLSLEREIAKERLKGSKLEIQSEIDSINWLKSAVNILKKYGALVFLRKILKL